MFVSGLETRIVLGVYLNSWRYVDNLELGRACPFTDALSIAQQVSMGFVARASLILR